MERNLSIRKKEIISFLQNRPRTMREISRKLNSDYAFICKKIKELEEEGKIKKIKFGKIYRISLNS